MPTWLHWEILSTIIDHIISSLQNLFYKVEEKIPTCPFYLNTKSQIKTSEKWINIAHNMGTIIP